MFGTTPTCSTCDPDTPGFYTSQVLGPPTLDQQLTYLHPHRMALVQCQECGRGFSDEAGICPDCGAAPAPPTSRPWWVRLAPTPGSLLRVAGVLLIAGSWWAWVIADFGGHELGFRGTISPEGKICAVIGVLTLIVGLAPAPRVVQVVAGGVAAFPLGVAMLNLLDLQGRDYHLGAIGIRPGFGLWLLLTGAVIGLIAPYVGSTRRP